jgi:benzil reductase ((S)-benzoin forming)
MATSLIWISGASSGIGRALAETVPWDGARVIDVSRTGAEGLEHVAADLSEPDGWESLASSFVRELDGGEVERAIFLHCAATLHPIGFAGEVDPHDYARQVVLNSASPQVLGDAFVRAAAGHDLDATYLVLTSGAASSVYEGWSAYGAGKAAVDQWVRVVGAERERRDPRCRVLAVAPGVVATPMQETIRSTPQEDFPARDKFVGLHERGELRDPADAARDLWRIVTGDFENGAVIDVRDLEQER